MRYPIKKENMQMFKAQILLVYIFAFVISIAEAQGISTEAQVKVDMDECTDALQGEMTLIEALKKMNLPHHSHPEKIQINLRNLKHDLSPYSINTVDHYSINSINSAKAFKNLWNEFPNSRDRLIAIANEINIITQSRNFDINKMHKIYEMITDKLLRIYRNLQTQSKSPIQTIKTIFHHEMIILLKRLYLTESEQKLRDERHSDSYIKSFDHVMESLRLAQSLRTQSINPYTTHIPEFADQVNSHITFIEEGIISQESSDKNYRLSKLEILKTEAESRQKARSVTYRWWLNFNLRLSILATPAEITESDLYYTAPKEVVEMATNDAWEHFYEKLTLINYKKGDNLYDYYLDMYHLITLLNQFPERIMIPTIHDLGIIPINKSYGTGVHLIGLNNKLTRADNQSMDPYNFFMHDVVNHAIHRKISDPQLLIHLQYKLEKLPKFRRQPAEYIYFEVTHEEVDKLTNLKDITSIRKIITKLINEHHRIRNNSIDRYNNRANHAYIDSFLPFIPNYATRTYDSIEGFITEGAETFTDLILEVHEELGISDSN